MPNQPTHSPKAPRWLAALFIALLCPWGAATATAQPLAPQVPPAAPGRPGPLRQRVARMIEQWKQMRIISALNLSPQQSPRFFAVLHQYDRKIKALQKRNHQALKTIRRLVRAGRYNARTINTLAEGILQNQVKIKQVEVQRFRAAKTVLTAQQLAKLVLTLPRLERRIRQMIRRAKRRGGRPFAPNLTGP